MSGAWWAALTVFTLAACWFGLWLLRAWEAWSLEAFKRTLGADSRQVPVAVPEPELVTGALMSEEEMQTVLCWFSEFAALVREGKVIVLLRKSGVNWFYVETRIDGVNLIWELPTGSDIGWVRFWRGGPPTVFFSWKLSPAVWTAALDLRDALRACVAKEAQKQQQPLYLN